MLALTKIEVSCDGTASVRDFRGLLWFPYDKTRVKCGDFAVFPQARVLILAPHPSIKPNLSKEEDSWQQA